MRQGEFKKELCESTSNCLSYVPVIHFDKFGACDSYDFQYTVFNLPGQSKRTTRSRFTRPHDLMTSSSDSTCFFGTTTTCPSNRAMSRLWSSYVDRHTSAQVYSQQSPMASYLQEKRLEPHSDMPVFSDLNDQGRRAPWPEHPTFCGTKRKMPAAPAPSTARIVKKPKLLNRLGNGIPNNAVPSAGTAEERQNSKRMDFRREKQKRRRKNNTEKYGDMYRLAFTCAFCKYRTFEDKDIETHFEGASHCEMLNYIRKQAKYDEDIMTFLHESMLIKFQKMSRKLKCCPKEKSLETPRELMEGVTEEDYMRKVEMVHCAACESHFPAVHSSVQLHLKSTGHLHKRMLYKERLRRDSMLTASSILKARYERYVKGEDRLDIDNRRQLVQTQEESSCTEDQIDATQVVGNLFPKDCSFAESLTLT